MLDNPAAQCSKLAKLFAILFSSVVVIEYLSQFTSRPIVTVAKLPHFKRCPPIEVSMA